MTDCPNGEMRDRLPDLLHDRLAPAERREVQAHLAGCADCRAELTLLGDVRASLRAVPAVNVAAIAAAIPAYRPLLVLSSSRRSWVGWRVAAAITILAVGGSSAVLLSRSSSVTPAAVVAAAPSAAAVPATRPTNSAAASAAVQGATAAPVTPVASSPSTRVAVVRPSTATPAPVRELAVGASSTGDLTESELNVLLKDVESLDAVPSTDVESSAIIPARGRS